MGHSMFRVPLVACSVLLAASGIAAHEPDPAVAHTAHGGCDHAHTAPHGGTLIALGDHVGHVELLLDAVDGTVRLYVLGAHAEKAVRIADHALTIDLRSIGDAEITAETMVLHAVPSLLTGEQVGDTSEFAAANPTLVGAPGFAGQLRTITVRGVTFADVAVSSEAGAEDHGDALDHAHPEHGHDH